MLYLFLDTETAKYLREASLKKRLKVGSQRQFKTGTGRAACGSIFCLEIRRPKCYYMVMSELSLLTMNRQNFKDIVKLDKAAFPDVYWPRDVFLEELKDPHTFYPALYDGKNLVAYGGLAWYKGARGEILTIAVEENQRGKSYGAVIFSKLLEKATELKLREVFLEVRILNEPALGLYEKFGFITPKQRKTFDEAGQTIKKMTLDLKNLEIIKIFNQQKLELESKGLSMEETQSLGVGPYKFLLCY